MCFVVFGSARGLVLLVSILVGGCGASPVFVGYEIDQYGVPECVVNGEKIGLTDDERRAIAQSFVDAYCPVDS